ncbi:1-acyl-sn-glycerol-3-phosphate acyltransferase BAT2, chloroplastic [Amaranthus tricolor]|uniref:1-acyl-sn-glycerol-3-phosphate acyltransferase BAT2, chloroplastic n=1 Tax=Amaranthus tricolor TaxID=29722 RepID=UPI00258FA650|nr:1-acyl-sn-glycerol-3-phosphate acyltransferase BAT2, chloroplastic [Amaranthus tricolor]XP_057524334.1 1-acyl-sn-glycerol-3-phosphate acyltransferase BAT2, chloroplastic [Amaranthus tricolor]
MAPPPAVVQLPLAITPVGDTGFLGSCHLKGNLLHPDRVTSKVSFFRSCRFLGVASTNSLHPNSFLELVATDGHHMHLKKSMKYRTSCIQRICSFCQYNEPAKRSERSHISRKLHFFRSLRHIAARSDIIRSGAPEAASPFPEAAFGPKARGVCFYAVTSTVAIFLFVLMVVFHPFVLVFDRYRRRAHYFVAKMWATTTIVPFFDVEVEGLEHLPPPDTPAVYVSNHQSFLDIYTLLTLGRSFKFISKTSIFLYPIIGWAMYLMGVIPLKRMDSRSQMDCLKRCMDLIRGGASVFFFPEGTRSKDGNLGAFKKGAFSVAAKTQVPVVPMTIIGTGRIMPAGKEGLLNPGSVKVVIHPCLMGKDAQVLCNQARTVIAGTLIQQA